MPEEDLQYIGRTIKEVVPRDNTVIYRGQGPQLFVRTYHTADSVIVPTIALQALQEQAPHIDFYRGEAGRQLFDAAEMFHDMKNDRNFRGIRLDSIMEFVYKGNQDMRRFFISQVNKLPISEVKRAIGNTSLMKETKERLEDFFVQYREKNKPQLVYPGKQKLRVYFDMNTGEQVEVPGRSSPVEIVTQRATKPSEYDIFGPSSPGKKKVRPGSFWTPDYDYAYSYINTEAKPAIYRIVATDEGNAQLQKQVLTDAEWNKVRSPKVQKELVDYSNQLFQKGITGNSLRDVLTVLMFDEIKEANPGLVIQDVIQQHNLKNVDVAGARNIIKGYSLKLPNKMKGAAIAIPILGAIMSENQEESAVVGTAMAAGITLDPEVIKEEIAKVKERIKEYKDYGRRGNKEDIETAKEIYEDLQEQLRELNDQLKQSQTKPAKPKVEPKQAAAKKMITKASGEQLSFSDYLKGLLGDERGAVYLPPFMGGMDDPLTDVQELATGAGGKLREEDVMELKEEVEGMTPRPRDQGAIADDPLTPEEAKRVKNYENIVQRNVEAERQRQILKGALMPRNQADRDRLERQANRRARQAAAEQALIDAEEVVAVQKAMQRIRNKMLRGDLGTADALQKGRPRRTLTPEQRREMIRRTNLPQTERPYGSAIDDALRRIAEEQGSEAFLRGKPDLRLVPPPVEVTDDMFIAGGPEDPPKWMQREMAERAKAEKTRKPKAKGTKILGPLGYAIDTAFIVNELADLYGDKGAAPDYSDEEKNQRLKDLIIGQMTLGLDPLVTLGETMRAQEQSGQFVDEPSWLRSLYKRYGDAPTVQETLEAELTDEELAGFRQRIEDEEATEKMRMRSKSNRMLGLEDDKLIQDTLRNLGIED